MKLDFKKVFLFIITLPLKLAKLLSRPEVQKVGKEIAEQIDSLLQFAIPAVQLVESATPNRSTAELLELLNKVNLFVHVEPTIDPKGPIYKGLLLQAASAALRGNLLEALSKTEGAGILVGKKLVTDVTGIEGSVLDLTAQAAFTLLSKSFGTTLVTAA